MIEISERDLDVLSNYKDGFIIVMRIVMGWVVWKSIDWYYDVSSKYVKCEMFVI